MHASFLLLALLGAAAGVDESLAPWGMNSHPKDVARRHVEQVAVGRHAYAVRQGGTMDGTNCRSPVGVGMMDGPAVEQTWESNRAVRLENTGDTDVINPWLANGKNGFRTLDEIVASAVKPGMTDREKAHALWFQEIRHRYHWGGDNNELGDPVKVFNVYGHNTCGNDAICLAGLWKRAGLKVTPARVVGHCVTQCYFDGRWNLFDGDMHSMYLLRDSRTVAGEQDLVRDHDLVRRSHTQGILNPDRRANDEWESSLFLFEGPPAGDRNCVQDTTMNMVLRPGEAITWRWGHVSPIKVHGEKPRYPDTICNGLWEYRPDFSRDLWRKGATSITGVTTDGDGLVAEEGKTGVIVWTVCSPYVFVGGRLETEGSGAVFSLSWDGKTRVEAGRDLDQLFPAAGPARYMYRLRCDLAKGARLRRLAIVNDLQMAQLALPAMSVGDNRFVYTDQSPGERRVRITHEWVERSTSRPPAAPAAPAFPPDEGEAEGTALVFRWPAPGMADGDPVVDYHFELSDRQDMGWPLSPNFYKLISRTADRGKAQYTPPHEGLLAVDRTYYWRVRAKNAGGVWGPWSATWSFTPRGPAFPTDVALAVDRDRGTGVLRWKANPAGRKPAKYRIYGSDEKGFMISDEPYKAVVGVSKEVSPDRPANFVTEVSANEAAVIGAEVELPNANRAFYRVVAVDVKGNRSGPSDFAEAPRPLLRSRPITAARVGAEYRYALAAVRSLGDLRTRVVAGKETMNYWDVEAPRFAIQQGPAWLKIDERTGLLSGVPDRPGQVVVKVTATIDREVRQLDERALSWGQEKTLSTRTQRVGAASQTFALDVEPAAEEASDVRLPAGVRVVWDLDQAHREKTTTRERVCLNGLWRWQPADVKTDVVPKGGWGYFKVPAFWPGNTNYIQEDCQALHVHPNWKGTDLRGVTAAWHQREITIPAHWTGRRVVVAAEYVNSFAVVYVDGDQAGEVRFPAGEVDVTAKCRPGGRHVISFLVHALPLKGVLLSHTDTNSAREVKGTVDRRGLCGDVYLTSTPAAARISDVKIDTSVRKGEITVSAAVERLNPAASYMLHVEIRDQGQAVRKIAGKPFGAADVSAGRVAVTEKWQPEKLWDTHTPGNTFTARVSLVEAGGRVQDVAHPVRFGFREFWIAGRDFYLNGTRIFLSAVPLDNAQIGARTATYAGARETLKRLQSFGINFVYTHNYGCEPGSHVSFAEILRAADDVGMLVALSQPHFAHYDWKADGADRTNGYARHAAFYVRAAQDHPSVVAYAMSHNATGYAEDMNPDLIDGTVDPRKDAWSSTNARKALRAEAIVRGLDPGRIVYHHSSGNLGSMHTMNFYLNFAPAQEVSDWFEHWARKGVKPVFPCEYGVPFTWDWTMYRGWYKGERSFGSARVPWEFCQAEWSAQFLGDRAFRIGEREKQNLRWEAGQFRAGKLWHRWDYPTAVGSGEFDDRQEIIAQYITDNWRAHRTTGVSANSPWEYAIFWKPREGVIRKRRELVVDWDRLQRPGFSPDYIAPRQGQMTLDLEPADWVPTAAAEALLRNNRPLLAYIAGPGDRFTCKDHNYRPGETVEKQLIVINNSRETIRAECTWSPGLPQPLAGKETLTIATGEQKRVPLRFALPANLAAGRYELAATVRFGNGEVQKDSFTINVLPQPADPAGDCRIALFDPRGETARLLTGMGVKFQEVQASASLTKFDVLIIGRQALTPDGAAPDVTGVRDGLKVVVFEQSAQTLEGRFGFRVAEYGLRRVFRRVPDHPVLAGLDADHLHDWRGEATLLPSRLQYTLRPRYGPTVRWCGIEVPRVWRCGCRGNVASVLIERPPCGDFLSVVDGGHGLQYSPLLEYREGKGVVLFCQMDVTARTTTEPAAETLARNILRYVANWKARPRRAVCYVGDPAGKRHLEMVGFSPRDYTGARLASDGVLIVGPGGGKRLAAEAPAIARWLASGGRLLALGLDERETAFLPTKVTLKRAEHVTAHFDPPAATSSLAGIGPADVHNRDPRPLPLVTRGATPVGNGVLAELDGKNVVICQLVPWQFDPTGQLNLRRTFRRSSCLVTRLAANLGAPAATPLLSRFHSPVDAGRPKRRWLDGLYLDVPEEWDDPYRFFRW